MIKSDIRKLFIEKRKNIAFNELHLYNYAIASQFEQISLPDFQQVMTYEAMPQFAEFDMSALESILIEKNKQTIFYTPRVNKENNQLDVVERIAENQFTNSFGTIEYNGEAVAPDNMDIILVPLLAFDKNGFRVGYGKGYYDRLLAQCRKDCLKIGVSFFEPIEIDDLNEQDIQIDICITPSETFYFKE